jgi:hypothetical protein
MNTFVNAVVNQEARTANGMKARQSSANAVVDLFYNIGASRGKDVTPAFVAAFVENRELALRVAAWARDVRGGSGEREIFRSILRYLEKTDVEAAKALMTKVPELGRWDDIFVFESDVMKSAAYTMLGDALRARNGLAAKWTPRKGKIAAEIRQFFGMSPKFYRKSLVEMTKVVETQMCAKDWDNINFSHVPSLAAARYKKAFNRNTPAYAAYVAELMKPEDERSSDVKVNASAVYPYDVLKGRINNYGVSFDKTELNLIQAQWDALPDYMGLGADILPLVDVSGSMTCKAGGPHSKSGLTCLDVAVSLGLYLADKNVGKFKDTFLTFSTHPELMHLKGNINQKIDQMAKSNWEMSTDLDAALNKVLMTAIKGNVAPAEMPSMLLILSDMQFNACVRHDDTASEMIARKYRDAGYDLPKVVFWNLNASYGNAPVKFDKSGTALVSGFSPAVVKPLLSGDIESFTPEAVMMKTIMDDRYKVL